MKQKSRSILTVLSVVLVLVIAGCGTGGGGDIEAKKATFIGGVTGLDVEFLENSPPEEVTDDGTFPFQAIVKMKNQGETNVPIGNVEVSLIGMDPSDFGVGDASVLKDQNPTEVLTPMQKDPEGNILDSPEVLLSFPTANTNFQYDDQISANSRYIFRADVCYTYQTRAVSEICLLEDITNPPADAICEPRGNKAVATSGSPLKVTAFRQNVAGQNRIQLSFDISHVGPGKIFRWDPAAPEVNCPKDPMEVRNTENMIYVNVDTGLGASVLNCPGLTTPCIGSSCEGEIRLFNGERTITCTQDLPGGDNFIKPVQIVLDYNYFDKADAEVLVRRSSGTMS